MYTDLVEYIVKSLVDHPEKVSVSEMSGQSSIVIEVSVAEDDMGRVIGKSGKVINAIRTIVQVPGAREGKRISVEIV